MRENKKALFLNHDVNNQAGIALGYFELLLDKVSDLKDNPYASYIVKALLRTRELSSDLALTCIEEDDNARAKPENDFTKVSVQEHLVKIAKPSYEKMMEGHDITVNVRTTLLDEEKFCYVIDPNTFVRVRENIISNAVEAGATELNVHLEMKEYCVVFSFKDNGEGMTQDELDRVMLCRYGDGRIHGVGTRSILDAAKEHGCSITYSSEKAAGTGTGTGTTIRVLAPYCR